MLSITHRFGTEGMTRREQLRDVVRRPEVLTDALQILKSTVAATLAWWLSIGVLDSQLPFLAPWTALLTVHATVYRSLSRGTQTTVASAVGVGLSFVIGAVLGVNLWTFALAMLVGLVGSRVTWLRDEGVSIATTAVFVLGSGFGEQAPLLGDRMLEVAIGVGVGVAVNLAVIPPLRAQQAARYVDSINRRMGEVMISMADDLGRSWHTERAEAWMDETVSIDHEVESAWQTVRFARESEMLNPRRLVPVPRRPRNRPDQPRGQQSASYEDILARVAEGVSHLRHLARTIREGTVEHDDWDEDFRTRWVQIVRDAGRAIQDPDAEVEPVYDRLNDLAARFAAQDGIRDDLWPIYGSLITSVRHIAVVVDDVASARRAREQAPSNPAA
ncbi:hypothetical protein KUV85_10690 [Nocardioides panacisoli]|uniref:FUSC family protein n=1 Tax=Nocardioides panacisoli TaxID=627624 RepID=UPI001C62B8D0|nr:aromatic acid exporter family protein [Nocardioides panacisoli]QYJ02806.1 hypothetical protein KUV85_10690 [Nocardioides panacisoli]